MACQVILTRLPKQNADFRLLIDLPDKCVVSKPLLTYNPIKLDDAAWQQVINLDQYDTVIFISQNAVRYGLPILESYWPQWPESILWLAVGPATKRLMETEDLSVYSPKKASSEGLLQMPELRDERIEKALIVRGHGGRETLKEGLLERGVSVNYLEAYEREAVAYEEGFLDQNASLLITLIYSGEALMQLRRWIGKDISRYLLIVPSKRLQIMAIDSGFDKVELANSQSDPAMLEVLKKCIAMHEEQ